MRCKYIGESRCKNKATEKYQGVAVCAEHKLYLEERVNTVLGGKKAAQQMPLSRLITRPPTRKTVEKPIGE